MVHTFGTTAGEAEIVRERTEGMMKLVATQLDSHPQIIGMSMVAIIADWYGREGLDELIDMARAMRKTLAWDGKGGSSRRHGPHAR